MASTKRKAWLEYYLLCWNATEAARRAGYKHPNKQGPALKKKLKAEIDARLDELAMPANEVLARLAEQGRGDLLEFVNDAGLLDLEKLRASGKSHLIKKFKVTQDALGRLRTEIELYDGQHALELIGKKHGLFRERHEYSGTVKLETDLSRALDRLLPDEPETQTVDRGDENQRTATE